MEMQDFNLFYTHFGSFPLYNFKIPLKNLRDHWFLCLCHLLVDILVLVCKLQYTEENSDFNFLSLFFF